MSKHIKYLVLLLAALSFRFSNAAEELVVLHEGAFSIESTCADKTQSQYYVLPEGNLNGYSHVEFLEHSNNHGRYSYDYQPGTSTVTITASVSANRGCAFILGFQNKPRSWLRITYRVMGKKLFCRPPDITNDPNPSIRQFQSDLRLQKDYINCRLNLINATYQKRHQEFSDFITTKIPEHLKNEEHILNMKRAETARNTIKNLATAEEIRQSIDKLKKIVAKLENLKLNFAKSFEFSIENPSADFNYHRYLSIIESQKKLKDSFPGIVELCRNRPDLECEKKERRAREESSILLDNFSIQYRYSNGINEMLYQLAQLESDTEQTIIDYTLIKNEGVKSINDSGLVELSEQIKDEIQQTRENINREKDQVLSKISALVELSNRNSCAGYPNFEGCYRNRNRFEIPVVQLDSKFEITNPKLNWSNRALDQNVCFTVEFSAAPNTEQDPKPIKDGIEFVRINGVGVRFTLDPKSLIFHNGELTSSRSFGCIGRQFLKIRSNTVELGFIYGDGSLIRGQTRTEVFVDYGGKNQASLCSTSSPSTFGAQGCTGKMNLSVDQVDPEIGQELSRLNQELRKLKLDYSKREQELNQIQRYLDEIQGFLDFENVDTSRIRGISEQLDHAADAIESLRAEYDEGRRRLLHEEIASKEEFKRAVSNNDEEVESVKSRLIERRNIDLFPLIKQNEVRSLFLQGARVNPNSYAYLDELVNSVIRKLDNAYSNNRFSEWREINADWNSYKTILVHDLKKENKGEDAILATRNAITKIDEYIRTKVDEDGFRRDLELPADVKRILSGRLKYDTYARDIQDRLNQLKKGYIEPTGERIYREMLYTMLRSFEEFFWGKNGNRELEPKETEIKNGLLAYMDGIARLGIGFTPVLGDFVDFCELTTGKDLCRIDGPTLSIQDRALAGLGIFIGSGVIYREMRTGKFFKDADKITDRMAAYEESVKKLQSRLSGRLSKSKQRDATRKIITETFQEGKNLSIEEVAARGRKLFDQRFDYLSEIEVLDGKTLNQGLEAAFQGRNKYEAFEPAWKANGLIVKGKTTKPITVYRLYTPKKNVESLDEEIKEALESQWYTDPAIVRGKTIEEVQELLAIPNKHTKYMKVEIPVGHEIIYGEVSPNKFSQHVVAYQFSISGLDRLGKSYIKSIPTFLLDGVIK